MHKKSLGIIIADLLFHQKQMKAYEDVGSLWTEAWLYKDHPTLHVVLSCGPKLSWGCFKESSAREQEWRKK